MNSIAELMQKMHHSVHVPRPAKDIVACGVKA